MSGEAGPGPTQSIRAALIGYHRDSYVLPAKARELAAAEASEPVVGAAAGVDTIDCSASFVPRATVEVVAAALRRLDPAALSRYPEPDHGKLLKPAILARFQPAGVAPQQLFLGHGSYNLMERVIHQLLRADRMLGAGPQFNEIPSEFEEAGGEYQAFALDESGYRLPVEALEKSLASRQVSVVYVDNPNNPLGLQFDATDLERLARSCARNGTVLLVDEAWGDFLPDTDSAIHLVGRHPNVIAVRSFSKALGLAGERVGYMFMSEPLARYYRQIDLPFEPCTVGATLARAVLDAPDLVGAIRREAVWAKERVVAAFEAAGFSVLPSHPGVAIMAVEAPTGNVVEELGRRGIRVLAGSNFARTHPRWDDRFCRVRIVEKELVEPLCRRLAAT